MSGSTYPDAAPPWTVLVPVKSTAVGKSRIGLDAGRRAALARAMAQDTVDAIAGSALVGLVVALVEDAADGRLFAAPPIVIAHQVTAAGLNEAIREGAAGIGDGPVAVLPGDLPSLRPGELDEALAWAASYMTAVVADRDGTGTTLLTARHARLLQPRYGAGSFAAHCATGAVPLPVAEQSGLRRDVDVLADLGAVAGRRTRALLKDLRLDEGVVACPVTSAPGD